MHPVTMQDDDEQYYIYIIRIKGKKESKISSLALPLRSPLLGLLRNVMSHGESVMLKFRREILIGNMQLMSKR